MFERNKVDNAPDVQAVPVEIALVGGEVVKGKVMVPLTKTIADIINGPGHFFEFEPYGGERRYIAKSGMLEVRTVGVPRSSQLAQRTRAHDDFDPHAILGVGTDATWEEIRHAYIEQSKVYHPDRYASASLPEEVRGYLAATVRRINAAYAALEGTERVAKVAAASRSQPIYTSQSRA